MADNSKIVFSGGAGAAIGVALGMLFGGPDVGGIETQLGTTGTEVASLSGQIGAVNERLAALEASVSAEPETPPLTAADLDAAVSGTTGAVETALGDRIAALVSELDARDAALEAAIASAGAEQVDAILAAMDARYEERMREFREQMEARREDMRECHGKPNRAEAETEMEADTSSGDTTDPPDTAGTADASEAAAPDTASRPQVAQTFVLADGKVTAYVAGFLEGGEIVQVALNGFEVREIRARRSASINVGEETCTVTYTGIVEDAAAFEASCE